MTSHQASLIQLVSHFELAIYKVGDLFYCRSAVLQVPACYVSRVVNFGNSSVIVVYLFTYRHHAANHFSYTLHARRIRATPDLLARRVEYPRPVSIRYPE